MSAAAVGQWHDLERCYHPNFPQSSTSTQVSSSMSEDAISQAEALKDTITAFLGDFPSAVVKQGATTLFTLDSVECTVSAEYRRCVVYFWAEFLNMRRTVVEARKFSG